MEDHHDSATWMSLDEACGKLAVTPRRLGQLVHLGKVTRVHTGRAARYRVSDEGPTATGSASSDPYVGALVTRLFEMEAHNSELCAHIRALETQVDILLSEREELVTERDEAVSRWQAARRELRELIGNARGVIAETRSRVTEALHHVARPDLPEGPVA